MSVTPRTISRLVFVFLFCFAFQGCMTIPKLVKETESGELKRKEVFLFHEDESPIWTNESINVDERAMVAISVDEEKYNKLKPKKQSFPDGTQLFRPGDKKGQPIMRAVQKLHRTLEKIRDPSSQTPSSHSGLDKKKLEIFERYEYGMSCDTGFLVEKSLKNQLRDIDAKLSEKKELHEKLGVLVQGRSPNDEKIQAEVKKIDKDITEIDEGLIPMREKLQMDFSKDLKNCQEKPRKKLIFIYALPKFPRGEVDIAFKELDLHRSVNIREKNYLSPHIATVRFLDDGAVRPVALIRFLTPPRSVTDDLKWSFYNSEPWGSWWGRQLARFNFSVGTTLSKGKTDDSGRGAADDLVLVGLTVELQRYFNLASGVAFPRDSVDGRLQLYLGVTLDLRLLQVLFSPDT